VERIIKKERIELVHARSRVPAWVALLACRRARVPLVTTCHGVYGTHLLSRVMGWGKFVIAISHAVSRHMKDLFGVPHHRIRLIHRGVNLAEFDSKLREQEAGEAGEGNAPSCPPHGQGQKIIGIVGRITPIKGHRVLLKAMTRIARTVPEARLWIIGESPRRRYWDELILSARKMGIEDHVEFLGNRRDVPNLLKKMNLLVAPAVGEEAFGRVLIEAGALGVPVVASRIGGIVDVVEHGEDGILVPASDPAALAEAAIELLSHPEKAARLAEAMRRKVKEKFNDTLMFDRTLEVYREVLEKPKILVIKLSALGDVILSVPTLRELRVAHPGAHITALVERPCRAVLKDCPYLDDIIAFDRPRGLGAWPAAFRMGRLLAKEQYDICVDLQNSRKSHALAWLCGAFSRAGYATGKFDFLLNLKTREDGRVLNPVEHQFRTLSRLGTEARSHRLELWANPADDQRIEQYLRDHWLGRDQILVGINPGSSPQWKTKQWPLERFCAVCDALSKRNIRVVITGTAKDLPVAEAIRRNTRSKPIIAVGTTRVGELISLIRKCRVFITSDSAPMHIAAAVGTPFVGIFGPTDPRRHMVSSGVPCEVVWKELKCSPCYLKKCPLGLPCMKKIGVEEILKKIDGLIGETEAAVGEPDGASAEAVSEEVSERAVGEDTSGVPAGGNQLGR